MSGPRVRRSPEQARELILGAAESLLAEQGVAGVQIRAVAGRIGMTDAGIYHHFGTRDRLLEALLRDGGRRIRTGVDELLAAWLRNGADLDQLVEHLAAFYRRGYGELAAALHAAGWRDPGSGMLDPVVEALHALRPDPAEVPVEDTRLAVAALHQALVTEPLHGPDFRRSAGLTGSAATSSAAQLHWWSRCLRLSLGLP